MGKHAYLVMAHQDWSLLSRLLQCIDDSRNAVFVHVDRKASFPYQEIYRPEKASCTYIPRRMVSWGGFSVVDAELALLEAAAAQGYDYYHLISGQDLPLKSQDEIHAFFDGQDTGNSYVGFSPEDDYDRTAAERLGQFHFLQEIIGRDADSGAGFLFRAERLSLKIQRKLKVDRVAGIPFSSYKGSNWFSINHELAQYVLSRKKDIRNYFRYSSCSDELFLQSIVQDSPFRDKVVPDMLREIDWKRGRPYTYRKEDFPLLTESDRLFARKFSTEIDPVIIDMICARVGAPDPVQSDPENREDRS